MHQIPFHTFANAKYLVSRKMVEVRHWSVAYSFGKKWHFSTFLVSIARLGGAVPTANRCIPFLRSECLWPYYRDEHRKRAERLSSAHSLTPKTLRESHFTLLFLDLHLNHKERPLDSLKLQNMKEMLSLRRNQIKSEWNKKNSMKYNSVTCINTDYRNQLRNNIFSNLRSFSSKKKSSALNSR